MAATARRELAWPPPSSTPCSSPPATSGRQARAAAAVKRPRSRPSLSSSSSRVVAKSCSAFAFLPHVIPLLPPLRSTSHQALRRVAAVKSQEEEDEQRGRRSGEERLDRGWSRSSSSPPRMPSGGDSWMGAEGTWGRSLPSSTSSSRLARFKLGCSFPSRPARAYLFREPTNLVLSSVAFVADPIARWEPMELLYTCRVEGIQKLNKHKIQEHLHQNDAVELSCEEVGAVFETVDVISHNYLLKKNTEVSTKFESINTLCATRHAILSTPLFTCTMSSCSFLIYALCCTKSKEYSGAMAKVLHDAKGMFVAGSYSLLELVESAAMAEVFSMRDGLELAKNHGCNTVEAESDAVEVINACTGEERWGSSTAAIFAECVDYISIIGKVYLSIVLEKQILVLPAAPLHLNCTP